MPEVASTRHDPATSNCKTVHRFELGQRLYGAGEPGASWRIRQGSVRLDRPDPLDSNSPVAFAGIALAGDVLGAETLLFGRYAFTVHALSDVELEPWLAPSADSLLSTLAAAERRTAENLALRSGDAIERIRKLFMLLTRAESRPANAVRERGSLIIPSLRDMSEITDLTQETVSRSISRLRKLGLLRRRDQRHGIIDLSRLAAPITLARVA